MIKLLPIVLVILLILGALAYFRFYKLQSPPTPSIVSNLTNSPTEQERISSLENKVEVLARQVADEESTTSSPAPKSSPNTTTEQKVKSLETTVAALQTQINQLKISGITSSSTQTTTSTPKAPVYIPLGWVGAVSSTNWATITSQELAIDPANYPGYKSMQFEVNLRIYQGNGTSYARLLNNNDGTAVTNSEISTTSQDYTWISSSTFTLPSSEKTYRMQLKSSTGYEAGVVNARIKVNY